MSRIVIDPITRIEGHLRIDVEVDGGQVRNSWSSGQMWRGIEIILQGRDPRDAWMFGVFEPRIVTAWLALRWYSRACR